MVGVAGVHGFSNNYEFSEYLLDTNVFMQWPLVRILFVFFKQSGPNGDLQSEEVISYRNVDFSQAIFPFSGHCATVL